MSFLSGRRVTLPEILRRFKDYPISAITRQQALKVGLFPIAAPAFSG
jgi:hypothetical protein